MNNYVRPKWDEYFFDVVDSISKRGTCDRGRSGCVIVYKNQILTTGYVGSPPGFPHCDTHGHQFEQRKKIITQEQIHEFDTYVPDDYKHDHDNHVYLSPVSSHCTRTIHAEQNAICQAAKNGVVLENSTMYCKMTPCRTCAMLIISCGIKEVKCQKKYHAGEESEEMFKMANISVFFRDNSVEKY